MKSDRFKGRLPLLLALAAFAVATSGQTLQTRLDQQTDFLPSNGYAVDQLIEVAKRFQIPMGIEWLEQPEIRPVASADREPDVKTETVRELVTRIVSQSPEHQLLIEDGIVHVYSQSSLAHPFNFLNLRIESFGVEGESLYGGEASLCTAINITLDPKLFENGWAGGYGGYSASDPDRLFYIENVTISGDNLTIREILNQLARENGNALWVVKLEPGELDRDAPYWKGQPLNEAGHSPLNHRWQFIPLADLSRLARERVTLELTIDGFFTARQFVFPVIMEHSLGRTAGSGNGIFSSDGTYCSYSIAVKEVRPDIVTLAVNVTTKPLGKAETVFSKDVEVVRGRITEHQVGEVIGIKAFIEAHKESSR